MRKTIAISLLLVHVYNLVGYKAVFTFLQKEINASVVSKLDKGQYLDDDLVEIRLPFKMLYNTGASEYVRYDGEIEIGGEHYSYVKRKLVNDTLYLLCLPNTSGAKLASAKNNYFDNINEASISHPKKSGAPSATGIKTFSTDFNHLFTYYDLACASLFSSRDYPVSSEKTLHIFIDSFYIPPRQNA